MVFLFSFVSSFPLTWSLVCFPVLVSDPPSPAPELSPPVIVICGQGCFSPFLSVPAHLSDCFSFCFSVVWTTIRALILNSSLLTGEFLFAYVISSPSSCEAHSSILMELRCSSMQMSSTSYCINPFPKNTCRLLMKTGIVSTVVSEHEREELCLRITHQKSLEDLSKTIGSSVLNSWTP